MKQTDSPEDWARPKPETLTEPTWWPAALAFGATLFIWGLVASYVIAAIGFIVTVTSLSGWIGDIRHEHNKSK